MSGDEYGRVSALDQFIAAETDDARLALELDVLKQARTEAGQQGLLGWEEAVQEFVTAIESGKGLNRPW